MSDPKTYPLDTPIDEGGVYEIQGAFKVRVTEPTAPAARAPGEPPAEAGVEG